MPRGRIARELTEQEKRAIALVKDGMPQAHASKETGIDRVRLFKLVKRQGVQYETAYHYFSPEEEQQLVAVIRENLGKPLANRLTNAELATSFGCSVAIVRRLKIEHGLKFIPKQLLKHTQEDLLKAISGLGFQLLEDLPKIRTDTRIRVRCFCSREFVTLVDSVMRANVHSCGCLVSAPQLELKEFVVSLGFDVKYNDCNLLNGREVDIYVPERKLAIEYNGLRWHAESIERPADYHYRKYFDLKSKGIQLITIFEDEYLERREIVLSAIATRLGRAGRIVGARKCIVVQGPDVKRGLLSFIEANHLQGAHHGLCYGLKSGNEIVAAMSFRRNNRMGGHWELNRFCVRSGFSVPGAFSRLMASFVKEHLPEKIYSLSDNRWSQGRVYETNGFVFDRSNGPDYTYVVGRSRKHKSNFAKKKLLAMGLLPDETEAACTSRLGLKKIWDCGKIRWVWTP